ncbi:MAG: pilus assembly PilX N-terminal domain-containing protein [Candidatus Geothermincolales bacterium]
MEMRRVKRALARARRFFRRGEPGFAMIVVLIALMMLSVLGAASLLFMVSSMRGIVNMKPEQRAFLIAEAGLYAAHALIVEKGTQAAPFDGEILGGKYEVDVRPVGNSTTEFIVTSLGIYEEGGTVYRRKLQEQVIYSGEQAFDALRNYIFFAARDVRMEVENEINYIPIVINGNIRAERNVNLYYFCMNADDDAFTVNGSVEGGSSVTLEAACRNRFEGWKVKPVEVPPPNPYDVDGTNVQVYGDIKAGSKVNPSTPGIVTLKVWSGLNYESATRWPHEGNGKSALFAAAYGPNAGDRKWNIVAPQLQEMVARPLDNRGNPHDRIYRGNYVQARGVDKIYIPQPNFEYYKLLAMDQGNFYDVGPGGTATITGNIIRTGTSSMTVYYSTGNMVLDRSTWANPNTHGVFVCEGDFVAVNETGMRENCTLQVIAKGNVTFDSRWSGSFTNPLTNSFFLYGGGDVTICMTRFSRQYMQATALRDVILTNDLSWSFPEFNYRPPQIDVGGWPIDIKVVSWMELPVDME